MVLNLSYLEEITGGDTEMILEMIDLFISDIPTNAKKMNEFLTKNDFESVRAEAHKIKPTLQYIGLTAVFENIKRIESIIKNGEDTSQIPEFVDEFTSQVEIIIPLLIKKKEELS